MTLGYTVTGPGPTSEHRTERLFLFPTLSSLKVAEMVNAIILGRPIANYLKPFPKSVSISTMLLEDRQCVFMSPMEEFRFQEMYKRPQSTKRISIRTSQRPVGFPTARPSAFQID